MSDQPPVADLVERVAAPLGDLYAALVAAQLAFAGVAKDGDVQQQYRYTTTEAMVAATRGPLNGAGLALFRTSIRLEASVVHLVYSLVHGPSGQRLDIPTMCPVLASGRMPMDKATHAAVSEALNYLLRDLLLVPRGEEHSISGRDDTQAAQQRQPPQQQRQQQAPRQQPAQRQQGQQRQAAQPAQQRQQAQQKAQPTAQDGVSNELAARADLARKRLRSEHSTALDAWPHFAKREKVEGEIKDHIDDDAVAVAFAAFCGLMED